MGYREDKIDYEFNKLAEYRRQLNANGGKEKFFPSRTFAIVWWAIMIGIAALFVAGIMRHP